MRLAAAFAKAAPLPPSGPGPLDGDTLWRVCTRNIIPEDARDRVRVAGDRRLAEQALRMVSIVR